MSFKILIQCDKCRKSEVLLASSIVYPTEELLSDGRGCDNILVDELLNGLVGLCSHVEEILQARKNARPS